MCLSNRLGGGRKTGGHWKETADTDDGIGVRILFASTVYGLFNSTVNG